MGLWLGTIIGSGISYQVDAGTETYRGFVIDNVSADENILTDGSVDYKKLDAIIFDPAAAAYIRLGEKVGNAFKDGAKLK